MDVVRLYKRAEELEESTAEARYRTLQNQLNPHFLFNSLNTLVSEIEYNPVNAIEFTRNLADTYRYILYCQDKHTVELNEELQFLDTYVLLQKVRLGDCLQVDNRIADKFGETPVPPLSLQLLVENVIKREVNANILRLLNDNFHVIARPLHGDWILTVRKETGIDPETGTTLDWGYVGQPTKVKINSITDMTDAGVIPVITPLGLGEDDSKLYNVNADVAAVAIAKALRVRKLVFISDVPGLLRDVGDPTSLISTLRVGNVVRLKEEGVISGGMIPKIDSCVEAIEAGVQRVHLVDGRMPHSLLLEIFTKQGVGTEIKADE